MGELENLDHIYTILALYVTMNQVKSKYRYMGFGLWENTDPTAPKPIKKPSPPPPPPKVMTLELQKNKQIKKPSCYPDLAKSLTEYCPIDGGDLKRR